MPTIAAAFLFISLSFSKLVCFQTVFFHVVFVFAFRNSFGCAELVSRIRFCLLLFSFFRVFRKMKNWKLWLRHVIIENYGQKFALLLPLENDHERKRCSNKIHTKKKERKRKQNEEKRFAWRDQMRNPFSVSLFFSIRSFSSAVRLLVKEIIEIIRHFDSATARPTETHTETKKQKKNGTKKINRRRNNSIGAIEPKIKRICRHSLRRIPSPIADSFLHRSSGCRSLIRLCAYPNWILAKTNFVIVFLCFVCPLFVRPVRVRACASSIEFIFGRVKIHLQITARFIDFRCMSTMNPCRTVAHDCNDVKGKQ